MKKIKKGDIVGRISYGKDIFFVVDRIINNSLNSMYNEKSIAILKGLTIRIKADSPLQDLEVIDKEVIKNSIYNFENRILSKIYKYTSSRKIVYKYGNVLHLDGDPRYSQKAARYYKNIGIDAIVKNIAESRQPKVVKNLLQRYRPDVLVITGHDGMIKNGTGFNDIYNYRNSIYFINTVKIARSWENHSNNLAIFAGACQSYYEAIIQAGANFASSPARILIDFIDPLIVAENISTTDKRKFVTIKDFEEELHHGQKGISGVGTNGKSTILLNM